MDKIASNFKIGSSVPETFSVEAKKSIGLSREKLWGASVGFIIILIAYYYRESLLKMYNAGVINYIWSALYLTTNGEVATTQIPETSLANSLVR